MKKLAALVALAGLAGSAFAQPGNETRISVKVRPFGTTDAWVSSATYVSANLVDPIVLEVGVFVARNTGYGLSTVVASLYGSPYSAANGDAVSLLDRTDSSNHPDGRVGNFNFGGQFQVLYHTGTAGVDANRFRIAANSNPNDVAAGGISLKQNTPVALGTAFDQSNDVLAYHYKLSLACYNNGAQRTITLDAPKAKVNSFTVYAASTSTTATNIIGTLLDTAPASVVVSWAPAPASLALLGLGGLVAGRRRR
jgi:hypothetical protein